MDCVVGKLFVGGLKRVTSEETLEQHFSKYGQLKDCIIMKNWSGGAGRSRGFGFVTFVEPFHAHHALLDCRNPIIDGKMVEVKQAIPRDAYTRVNVYNAYNTGFELGFGTSVSMNGFSSSSGAYVYPYNGGMCYYYCASPFMVPHSNYNFVAPCFCGANMYTGWNCNYYTHGSHINGGVDHYYVSEDHHVNYGPPRGPHINGRVDDSVGNVGNVGNEELASAEQANPSTPRGINDTNDTIGGVDNDSVGEKKRTNHVKFSTRRGSNDFVRNKKRADHANFSIPRGANDTLRNKEGDDHANVSTPRGAFESVGNEERANRDPKPKDEERANRDPKPKDSGGDVSSRSNGNDDCPPPGITMSVHTINEVILQEQYSG